MTMQKSTFTLQQYSCIAGVLLLIHQDADAGAVYTDIEPDIEIQYDNETVYIDMDNNGVLEFNFLKTTIESYYYVDIYAGTYHYRSRRGIWAGAIGTSQNELAGVFATDGGDPTTYFVYKLNSGNIIDGALSFQNANYQIMAAARYRIEIDEDWYVFTGGWDHDPQNKYIGVRFKADECLHYGWIRCSMQDTANKLIIHDYAFESKCNTGIAAGDIIGDTSVGITDFNSLNVNIYSFGNSVFVKLNAALNNAEMHVYTLEGKEIYRSELQKQFTEIKINSPKGIYFVKIISEEGSFTKKVYFD